MSEFEPAPSHSLIGAVRTVMSHELDLFSEMDAAADMLRENNPTLRDSLSDERQLEFRQLQKKRMPQLSKEQFLDLFHEWRDHYLARLEIELAEVRKRMAENDCKLAELRRRRGNSTDTNRFVCKCGEVIADPLDPEQMKIHQPHFIAASLPQVHAALERWRNYARRTVETAGDLGGET